MCTYHTPVIEFVEATEDDVISTSYAVELPWTPLESGEEEI
jgi:hypothetical protein